MNIKSVRNIYCFNIQILGETQQPWCQGTKPGHSCRSASLVFTNLVFTMFFKNITLVNVWGLLLCWDLKVKEGNRMGITHT
jgi:hypothetical protein